MIINIKLTLNRIRGGESLDSVAQELKISRSLLYLRLKEYCKSNNLEMPKKKAGRKVKIIFE